MSATETYDVVVVGGGPAGATAATDLAETGHKVLLLDKAGRIKPCGGAIPPRLLRDFDIPDDLMVAKVRGARIIAPSDKQVDMPIEAGFVGMVDREHFDEWLRARAERAGAARASGEYDHLERHGDGMAVICYRPKGAGKDGPLTRVRARAVIGADGARSQVARQAMAKAERVPCVFAYHEIIRSPRDGKARFDPERCDVYYQGKLSPDFYAWVFPHGDQTSIGTGTANKGFSLRGSIARLRAESGMADCELVRREGAPIPLKPRKIWDNGRDVVLAGDAAGVVAPASGEGIYYAMISARFVALAVQEFLATGDAKALGLARKTFMKAHGKVFWILGIMQRFWYTSDWKRERFVKICDDKDVQRLTWESYMNKELTRRDPAAHMRIFFKDLAHLFGLARV